MRVALDTNRYTDLAKGDSDLARALEAVDVIYMPFVVVAELRAGFSLGTRGKANEHALDQFLRTAGIEVVFAGAHTLRTYASLYRQLRRQGTPIPTNDLWIAALVVEHGLTLCTRDRHFEHLPQIAIV